VGSLVRLSTGEVAVVVRNHDRLLARPTVRLVLDRTGSEAAGDEMDLAETDPGGDFVRTVTRSVDPSEVGVDMLSLLASSRFDLPPPEDVGPGLVHEPAPTETPPEGYVEAHGDVMRVDDLELDPEAGPAPPE
jgi:hypothetical protein